jgi:hypothetical protein
MKVILWDSSDLIILLGRIQFVIDTTNHSQIPRIHIDTHTQN